VSFYEDATIADLQVVLLLVLGGEKRQAMHDRFIAESLDADLLEVLADMKTDAAPNWYKPDQGIPANLKNILTAIVAVKEALQGIEDQEQATVQVTTTEEGVTILLAAGGTTVEFP